MSRVDVVLAVHTPTRPVGRAVASVLDGNGDVAAVTVVCHGVSAAAIADAVAPAHRDRVRFLEHSDGVRSAAGPFNAGMRAARGEFVSLLGSDDTLEPGAVTSWLELADASGAETVVSRLLLGRRAVPTPPVRPRQRDAADLVRDRLSYRSAPLGLVSTAARERLGAELAEGLPVADDVPYVTRLWHETRVVVARRGPAYRIGQEAADRVTYEQRPVAAELAVVPYLLAAPWFAAYPQRVRTAVATKLLRIHVFGAVWHRQDADWWTPDERRQLAGITASLVGAAPRALLPLPLADRSLADACLDPGVSAAELVRLARARRRHGTPRTLVPRHPAYLLHREAPPRFLAASLLAAR